MKNLYKYLVLVFLFCVVSCSSYKILPEQITVVVSSEVLQSSSKLYAIDRYKADAYLDQYLRAYAKEYQLRNTLKIETTITDVRIGRGRDFMVTETVVREGGREIDRFTYRRSTGRKRAAKRITSALAEDIMSNLRGL